MPKSIAKGASVRGNGGGDLPLWLAPRPPPLFPPSSSADWLCHRARSDAIHPVLPFQTRSKSGHYPPCESQRGAIVAAKASLLRKRVRTIPAGARGRVRVFFTAREIHRRKEIAA